VHADGQLVSVQNQYSTTGGLGGWFLVGANLRFAPGTAGYVELNNNAPDTNLVSADAARFVFKGLDVTAPTPPIVIDSGAYTSDWTSLQATWTGADPETGISGYEYRVVEAGGSPVTDWISAGTTTGVTATGLPLQIGPTYVFQVRAVNGANMVSPVGASDGIRVFTFDANVDGEVNGLDLQMFYDCLSASGVGYPTGPGLNCGAFDTDRDNDVDMEDYGKLQICLTGMAPADPSCLD
jgi:hypothetical protein